MEQARADSTHQIEEQIGDVAVEVLHVVPEDPQEKHVAGDVRDAGVQKHAGEQRKKRHLKGSVAGKPCGDARRDGGIGGEETLEGGRRERVLVDEKSYANEDEGGVYDRIRGAGRRGLWWEKKFF